MASRMGLYFEDHMQQLDLPRPGRPTLTRDAVVDELVLRLRQRSMLAAERRAAHLRLARYTLEDDSPAESTSSRRQQHPDRVIAA
jgi:hypothetical protein